MEICLHNGAVGLNFGVVLTLLVWCRSWKFFKKLLYDDFDFRIGFLVIFYVRELFFCSFVLLFFSSFLLSFPFL